MISTKSAARRAIRRLAGVAALVLAAWLPGQGIAQDDLVGIWEIRVLDGLEGGDYGQIVIRQAADGLVGDMVFTDAGNLDVIATQTCRIWKGKPTIQISCTILTVDPQNRFPTYVPDNFILRLVSPDRMEGKYVSNATGNAILTRGVSPTS